jgi:4-hydroxybenzoate polyprenyltransferase
MIQLNLNIKNNLIASYKFIKDINFFATVAPTICICISQNIKLKNMICTILYATLYFYQFQVGNQITNSSIIEDKINKPYRPIVSGIICQYEAYYHLYVSIVLYIIFGYIYNIIFETLFWIFISYLLNFTWLGKDGIIKNCLLFPGTYSLIVSSLTIINGKDFIIKYLYNILFLCLTGVLNGFIQDLKDHEGDLIAKRKTLSIVYGFDNVRKKIIICPIISFIFLIIEIYKFPTKRFIPDYLYIILNTFCFMMIIKNLYGTPFSKHNVRKAYNFYFHLYLCILFLFFPS